jgi:hypothetical protein
VEPVLLDVIAIRQKNPSNTSTSVTHPAFRFYNSSSLRHDHGNSHWVFFVVDLLLHVVITRLGFRCSVDKTERGL